MTPEEKRLENAKQDLLNFACLYAESEPGSDDFAKRRLFVAAMDYAETVHYVEWLRAKQAEERDKRLSET